MTYTEEFQDLAVLVGRLAGAYEAALDRIKSLEGEIQRRDQLDAKYSMCVLVELNRFEELLAREMVLRRIVDVYDMRSELATNDADLASNLAAHARKGLNL